MADQIPVLPNQNKLPLPLLSVERVLARHSTSLPVSPGVIAASRHIPPGRLRLGVLPAIRARLVRWWATQKVEPEGHPHGGKAGLRSLGGDLLISNCLGKRARISLDDPP